MCGILLSTKSNLPDTEFRRALAMLKHRGPDATGYVKVGRTQLGHQRLKILDLGDRSNQPFYSANGRYAVAFNGEIYNYAALARAHGIRTKTTADTEVLVELYAKLGPRMVEQLNGMFAFAILDTQTQELFVARDRLGVKPLYMRRSGAEITLSSEISPLLALLGTPALDPIGVRQYRKLRTFFNGRTLYDGIEMFPAGSYMLDGAIRAYWELPSGFQPSPEDDELRALVTDAVQQRLLSDVPVGSYLSGGLDSTIITAVSQTPHAWTVGVGECNEFKWARLAAAAIGSTLHEVDVSREEFVETARHMIHTRREPLSVPNEVLLYRLTAEVARLNTVVLSGEGADELFFGYDRIFRWAAGVDDWDVATFARLYSYGSHDDLDIVADAVSPFVRCGTPLQIVAQFFQIAHLHGLLRRLDNATMAHSVEARVPFVDHHPLIERMAGVPIEYRMRDGVSKSPLKRIFRDLVPHEIVERPKIGFEVPLADIPWPGAFGATPMDRWLDFNLRELCGGEMDSVSDLTS